MRFVIALLVTHIFVGTALGQAAGVILLNALDEHTSCVTLPAPQPENTACQNQGRLPLGRTVHLLVLHRRFLTSYRMEIGETVKVVPPRPAGGEVRAVSFTNQASVLFHPTLSIERKTTLDFLDQLLDITSLSEPAAEIDRESQILNLALLRTKLGLETFNSKYTLVVGDRPKLTCDLWHDRRDGFWLEACLHVAYNNATGANEPTFRVLVGEADGLFNDARVFSAELADADLVGNGRAIESAITNYQDDLQNFKANLDSATEAVSIVQQFQGPGEPLLSLQIRERLRKKLAASGAVPGSSRPALDEAETNELIDRYFRLWRNERSISQFWLDRLTTVIRQLGPTPAQFTNLDQSLRDLRSRVDYQLPALVSAINDWQKRLAERVNDIYQWSDVPITLSDSGLNTISSNDVVSYRIVRTNEFEPYVFNPVSGPAAAATSVEVSRGAFSLTDTHPASMKRTIWQILRLTH